LYGGGCEAPTLGGFGAVEPPAHGVRHTDTAAHIQARNAADAYPVGGDRRPGEGSAQARVYAIDTRASRGTDEKIGIKAKAADELAETKIKNRLF